MHRPAAVALLITLTCASVVAQIPGPWVTVDTLPSGQPISITLKSGDRIEGLFRSASPLELMLAARTGNERTISKTDIRNLSVEKKDTSLDGLLLGAAIGAGVGAFWGYRRRQFGCRAGCAVTWGVLIFTPSGALVGWLRDRKHKHTEVLYQAP